MSGCVYKRGTRWYFVYELPRDPATNKRRRRHGGGFPTRRAAQAALTEQLAELRKGTFIEPSRQAFGDYLAKTWLPAQAIRLKRSTLTGYEIVIEKQVIPQLGSVRLQELAPGQLNVFYDHLLRRGRQDGRGGLSARSVRLAHTVIHKALADAVRWGLVSRNVADLADPPAPTLARADAALKRRTWTPEQLRTFLDHARDHELFAAFRLAAMTGARRGEVLGLRWVDLDVNAGRMSITQALVAPRYRSEISTPKTQRSMRAIALDAGTTAILREHRQRVDARCSAAGIPWDDEALVFTDTIGEPIKPALFSLAFQALIRAAGVPRIRLHDLRHTHASHALQAGIHPKVVSERLGHSSIAITLDTYSHVIPTLQETAAEVVAALISPLDDEQPAETSI